MRPKPSPTLSVHRFDYPTAEREPLVEELHGHRIADPYRWLENAEDPRTGRWLTEQESLWQKHRAALPGLAGFTGSVHELSGVGMITPPRWRGGRRFFQRQRPGELHPVLYVADAGHERVALDPTALDPSGLTTVDAWQPDHAGELLAYQISSGGTENAALYVLDLRSGEHVDGPIHGCRYSPVAWLPDAAEFYYVRADESGRRRVFRHRVGEPVEHDDTVLYRENPGTAYGIELGADGHTLLLAASRPGERGNDLWLTDTRRPGAPVTVHIGLPVQTAGTVGADGRLYLLTDFDAPMRRLCVADPRDPTPEHWRELVAEDTAAVLTGFAVLDSEILEGYATRPVLLASRTRHAVDEITVHDLESGAETGTVPLPGPGSVGALCTDPAAAYQAWFSYQDSVTPPAVYRYDARTGHTGRVDAPPGSATPPDVRRHRIVVTSADGTPVHATVFAPAPAERPHANGPHATVVYGYGGFGVPLTPTYSSHILAWVRAGGVFVSANLRGGGEGGLAWHRAGTGAGKQHVVDDVVAVAERLITDGWSSPETLALNGESNGGLVMAAAVTQRPELFAAAVCSAPVLDMVRYERFGFGASWRGEYGSADDPDTLPVLLGYSPYHRVRAGVAYPAVLLTAFAGDTRVDPMHARKMCAALQYASAGEAPILLRYERGVGHAGRAADRAEALSADMLAFLGTHTGLFDAAVPG